MDSSHDVSLLRVLFSFAVVVALMAALGFVLKYISARGIILPKRSLRAKRMRVVESMAIDGKRRLTIVACDGREHLLLLGGQSDIVVETNLPPSPSEPA